MDQTRFNQLDDPEGAERLANTLREQSFGHPAETLEEADETSPEVEESTVALESLREYDTHIRKGI